ncbi:MAG TPA: hypothetical protein VGM06_08560 [Polyangiaceae bacterium]|jgi:hypothetical protein
MLVPAMTFAWWLVSMSAHSHHHHRASSHDQAKEARTLSDAVDAPASGPVAPADAREGDADADESSDETSGERVALKVVTPAIVKAARTYLDLPMGAERTETIDGQRYVFVLEHHYHPPGFVGGPHGWHKGVTVYGLK